MAKTISISELKPGDIILYSFPKHSAISLVIALITHSPVSHTGIIDKDLGHALQEIEEGAERKLLPDAGTRKLFIRRLKAAPDTNVVVDIAQKYVDENLPYPMSNLVFLGLYILASDHIPDTISGGLIKNVLKIATYELIKLVNHFTHPGTDVPPMVCSQFAAACYDEAALTYGPEYKIHYNEEVTTFTSLLQKIIDQLTEEEEEKTYALEKAEHPLLGTVNSIDLAEEHCGKLAEHLQNKENEKAEGKVLLGKPSKISDEMISTFYQYGKWFLKAFGEKKDYPEKDEATIGEIKEVLEELLRYQETFITPGDLLSNTTNMDDMGMLTYTKEELDQYKEPGE